MGRTASTEPQCLYKGDFYHFYLSALLSSHRPYGANNVEMAPRFLENLCTPDLMLKEVKITYPNSESLSSFLVACWQNCEKRLLAPSQLSVHGVKHLVSYGMDFL
jgi:hypothetical protein